MNEERCTNCDKVLTEEEIRYYAGFCDRCERFYFDQAQDALARELADLRLKKGLAQNEKSPQC